MPPLRPVLASHARALRRCRRSAPLSPSITHAQHVRCASSSSSTNTQVHPLTDYYAHLLDDPIPYASPRAGSGATLPPSSTPEEVKKTASATSSASSSSSSKSSRAFDTITTAATKPLITFSAALAGPAERKAAQREQATLIAGVLVPPKPSEPDNCCMSGCVNCVWDAYRDDLEEWSIARRKADARLAKQAKQADPSTMPARSSGAAQAVSMDDDGGGSETNWPQEDELDKDLFQGLPVGILEFMKQEKRLKERHAKEAA